MTWALALFEELLPTVLFFLVQWQWSFAAGVWAMVVSTVVVTALSWWVGKTVPKFALASTAALLLFALPTIITGDNAYFQLSDTILDGGFALALLGSLYWRTTILEYFFGRVFAIPPATWRKLTWRWGLFFLCLAVGNEVVRLTQSTDVWSWYKLLSTIGIIFFGLYQFTLSARERIEGESNWLGLRL